MRSSSARRLRGFVLVMTLWVIAGIAVAVALMTLWALDAVRTATAERTRTETALALASTLDTVLYLGATRVPTRAGLPTEPLPDDESVLQLIDDFGAFNRDPRGGELRLDGTPYQGVGDIVLQLQDEAGLFQLNRPIADDLDRFLLDVVGAPRDAIPALRDAVLDYVDVDALRRLNGAEAAEYERDDRPPPPNRNLLVPAEVLRVAGWEALPADARGRLLDLTTTTYGGATNLNMAPRELLPAWVPGCPERCDAMVRIRGEAPFVYARDVEAAIAAQLPGDPAISFRFTPSRDLRVTAWGPSGAGRRIHVRFTPLADQRAPWSIVAAYPVARPDDNEPAQPTGSDLFADAPPG